jgi:lipoate-protein ligase A
MSRFQRVAPLATKKPRKPQKWVWSFCGFCAFLRPMNLEVLPTRTSGAAENMATDFLLLQRYPRAVPRFRHYDWRGPAFTFGYSQKIAFVRESLSAVEPPFELCRRATGGGVVDHRDDWTYALVIPRGHPLEELRATQSYREVHEALAAALRAQDVAAVTKPCVEEPAESASVKEPGPAGVCFQRAEIYDVVHERTGEKIAGAAQKRNKHGLLFQGSLWRPAANGGGAAVDWEKFEEDFVARLAVMLGGEASATPWPELNEDEMTGLVEQYAAAEWTEQR